MGIAGAQEEFDDGGRGQGLPRACGHLEKKPVLAVLDGALERGDGFLLVDAEKAKAVRIDESGAFGLVFPGRLRGIVWALGEDNVVIVNVLFDQAPRIGDRFLVAGG